MQPKKPNDSEEKKTCGPGLSDGDEAFWLFDRRCPECGKKFCVPRREMWVYKDRRYLYCSWRCMRAREKRQAEKAPKRGSISGSVRLNEDCVRQIRQMAKDGLSLGEISKVFGVSKEVIRYHVRDIRKKV